MRLLQPAAPCLIIFIDIVILDLAKIPIICLQQLGELLLPTVIGKPDRPDAARLLLRPNPILNPQAAEAIPCFHIRQHMNKKIIDIIRPQPVQHLMQKLIKIRRVSTQRRRHLIRYVYFFP